MTGEQEAYLMAYVYFKRYLFVSLSLSRRQTYVPKFHGLYWYNYSSYLLKIL